MNNIIKSLLLILIVVFGFIGFAHGLYYYLDIPIQLGYIYSTLTSIFLLLLVIISMLNNLLKAVMLIGVTTSASSQVEQLSLEDIDEIISKLTKKGESDGVE